MGSAAYDEQNNWGLFRLTMPLSRRDVVLGRYGAIATLGLAGMACGLVMSLLIMGVASVVELPGGLSEVLAFDEGPLLGMLFATAFCVLIGSVVAGVVTPIYFMLGQTKATQLLPTVIVLLFVIPVVVLGNSGFLDAGTLYFAALADILALIETPGGVAVSCIVFLVLAATALVVSALVSLRLYGRREL